MSHHLDSPLARQDVRLDITDLYVFRGEVGTVFVLNINNSIAGADAPRGFHPEAQYALRIDVDGDAVEDLTYRLTFGDSDVQGRQTLALRRLDGLEARDHAAPADIIAEGTIGTIIQGEGDLRLWAGRVPDPFYIDPTVLKAVGAAFKDGMRVALSTWQPGAATNLFADTTVNAIVLEVPDGELLWRLDPQRRIDVWATTMLATDAGGWHPVNRVGRPMIQPIFNPDDSDEASHYNTTVPAADLANYGERIAQAVKAVVAAQGTSADPQAYGKAVAAILLPDMLPYKVGTAASFGYAAHNGRALSDNAPDVMFSLVTNSALSGGLTKASMSFAPRDTFPYVASAE